MAITTPTKLVVSKADEFNFTQMAAGPLQVSLANSNHLYGHFCPNLLSFSPMGGLLAASTTYVVPVVPSVDGLSYDFIYTVLAGATDPLTIQVYKNTGANPASGWTSIYGPTATASMTVGHWFVHRHSTVIAANVTMLKFVVVARAGYDMLSHVAVQPTATAVAPPLLKASGFLPFDDSLISSPRAPINTEMVNRAKSNALNVLRDRKQCIASFVQPYVAAPFTTGGYAVSTPSGYTTTPWSLMGKATGFLPGKQYGNITVYCLSSVTGGATADQVVMDLTCQPLSSTGIDSTGLLKTDLSGNVVPSLTLVVWGTGVSNPEVPIEIRVRATAGHTTYIHSLIAFWTPTGAV